MAIEINNNTVIRIIFRRGTDSARRLGTLAQGEPGFTVDTQRLFVGDGTTGGGVVIGNKHFGIQTSRNDVTSMAQVGDAVFDTTANTEYVLTSAGTWDATSPTLSNLENSAAGIRVKTNIAGTGFSFDYNTTSALELNARYWNLTTTGYSNSGTLYFGTVSADSWGNYLNSRLTVEGPTHLNGPGAQIQLYSTTLSGAMVNFINSAAAPFAVTQLSATSAFYIQTNATSLSTTPGVTINGGALLVNSNLFVRDNVVVRGTLTVLGAASALATTITTVTALCAVTTSLPTVTAITVINTNTAGPGYPVLMSLRSVDDILFVSNRPFVGINVKDGGSYSSYNVAISGRTKTEALDVNGNLSVTGDISATGDIIAFSSSDATLKCNITSIPNALEKLLTLKGVEFDWRPNSIYSGHDVGVLAQDVEAVLPSAVGVRYDGYKGVAYNKIIPLMIEAIRELKYDRSPKH